MSRGIGLRQKAKELALMTFSCTLAKSPLPTHRVLNLRPPSSAVSCSAATMGSSRITSYRQQRSNDDESVSIGDDLESIFKQKKILRSEVRKSLKEMDLAQRSREDCFVW